MGGVAKSAGGFLGLSGGPNMQASTGNDALEGMNQQSYVGLADPNFGNWQNQYAQGNLSSDDFLKNIDTNGSQSAQAKQGELNQLATGATTGSKFASDQLQSNPLLSGLFGKSGELNNSIAKEQELQNQGFKLTPDDIDAYGQASGNIARQFGQAGNSLAQSLASRGLSQGPSGAAAAQFSGLNGNQNEQLAQAQTNIANQRMQNTMQRIGQQQQFISQLGGQANTALNNQYGRQLAGAQNQYGNLAQAAGQQTGANSSNNQANLGAAGFNAENSPVNFMDAAAAGATKQLSGSLFSGGSNSNKPGTTQGMGGLAGGGGSSGGGASSLAMLA